MFDNIPDNVLDDVLLSFNLINNADINKTKKILYGISNNIYFCYTDFKIKKKNGKTRKISKPNKILKSIQKNILNNVLVDRKISKYATAYIKSKSLIDNAICHTNKNVILKLDIKDFFDNITFTKVYNSCFNENLYPEKLGILLTNLCIYNERLPQGAPTSSYISNVILRDFDEYIGKWCCENNITYTRYSDDLTFSGDFNVKEVIYLVKEKLHKIGFKLNYEKIRVISKNKKQKVTGIIVNEKINIDKEYKRKIRLKIYYIKKYGLYSHMNKIGIKNKETYLNKLLGKVNYVLFILKDNKEFLEYKDFIIKLRKSK